MDPAAFPNLDPDLVDLVLSLPDMAGALDDVAAARAMVAGLIPAGTPYGEDELDITDEIAPGSPDVAVRVYRPAVPGPDRCRLFSRSTAAASASAASSSNTAVRSRWPDGSA